MTAMVDGRVRRLLSLASRQVWPHVLAVAHLKPERLTLLHSSDAEESRKPAERLKKFLENRSSFLEKGGTDLVEIPHDRFEAIGDRLDELVGENRPDTVLNFTGGNKLMATAAFRWADESGIRSFYLERGNQITWFERGRNESATRTELLDGNITNNLDPVALLRCQLWSSEVEREGAELTLKSGGRHLAKEGLLRKAFSEPMALMDSEGLADRKEKAGDRLELAAAAVLLHLGVTKVRRSLRLKVHSATGAGPLPHAEIDLLFNWNGKLWLVDCKDRKPEVELVHGLRRELPNLLKPAAEHLLSRLEDELQISPVKVLKEDLVAINDMAGLLGQVVCVRKSALPDEARAYAQRNRIDVVLKSDLYDGLHRLLHGDRPASPDQLARLVGRR